jgi:putative CocE/NonD family hydrolase
MGRQMSFTGWAIARIAKLDKPLSRDVRIERDLRVPMRDRVELLADRYFTPHDRRAPIVLIRTPYGRAASKGYGETFAARGYQVLVQSCRGTFGSGGEWQPFQTEHEDGLATVEWLRRQPWYGGKIGMYGPSYMGFVQWAIAADCPDEIRALSIQVASSQIRSLTYAGGAFALRTMLAWTYLVGSQAQRKSDVRIKLSRRRRLSKAYNVLPLSEADRRALGTRFPFFQDLLRAEGADAPLWKMTDFSDRVADAAVPVLMVTGWYDVFLLGQLADYRRLRDAGRRPELIIGPWGHSSVGWLGPALRGTLGLFDAHLRGTRAAAPPENPVRIRLMGSDTWLDLADWPPSIRTTRLHLHPAGRLAESEPIDSNPDLYRFDPASPTPDAGGNSDPGHGSRGNRRFAKRRDVLTYTSDPLQCPVDVIGTATAELWVRSSLQHTDFCARLCDVSRRGQSRNVCDGIIRLEPVEGDPDRARHVTVELWPTAYRFKPGHQIRLHVSSGAHPRYARNLGSSEPIALATTMSVADQEIFHDPRRPSALLLPICDGTAS